MAKTKQEKEKFVKDLTDKLNKTKSVVFVNYKGLKTKETEVLRKTCREEKIEYLSAKKTLLKLVLKNYGLENIPDLEGEIALALGYENEASTAKILKNFSENHEALKLIGGILKKKYVNTQVVNDLAKLPSKLELLAMTLRSIQSPLSGFVNVLSGNLRGLLQVLKAIQEIK